MRLFLGQKVVRKSFVTLVCIFNYALFSFSLSSYSLAKRLLAKENVKMFKTSMLINKLVSE